MGRGRQEAGEPQKESLGRLLPANTGIEKDRGGRGVQTCRVITRDRTSRYRAASSSSKANTATTTATGNQ